jgi:hypothetical protein
MDKRTQETKIAPPPLPKAGEPTYSPMLQGPGTNKLASINTRRGETNVNPITGRATIEDGEFTVFIEKYNNLAGGLRTSAHKLLDAMTITLTRQNHYKGNGELNTLVYLPLEAYMSLCNVPDTKASKDRTRRIVKEDLDILFSISIEWHEQRGKDKLDFAKTRICDTVELKSGDIRLNFSKPIAQYLTNAYVMQYPLALFKLDARNAPAYQIGRKIALHHSMDNNIKQGTANIISVRALLESCNIPSYDEVMAGDRNLDKNIISPFIKALDVINDTGIISSWEFCNSKTEPLSDAQIKSIDYKTLINCFIHFEMSDAPDPTLRLEAKTKRRRSTTRKKVTAKHTSH